MSTFEAPSLAMIKTPAYADMTPEEKTKQFRSSLGYFVSCSAPLIFSVICMEMWAPWNAAKMMLLLIPGVDTDATGVIPSEDWIMDAMKSYYGKDPARDDPFAKVQFSVRTRTMFFGWCFLMFAVVGWTTMLPAFMGWSPRLWNYKVRAIGGFQYAAITINIFVAVSTALNTFMPDKYFVPATVRADPRSNYVIIAAQGFFILLNIYNIMVGHADAKKDITEYKMMGYAMVKTPEEKKKQILSGVGYFVSCSAPAIFTLVCFEMFNAADSARMMLIGNPTVDHTGPFPSREWISDAMADMYGKD